MKKILFLLLFFLSLQVIGQSAPSASNVSSATVKNTNATIHLVARDADDNSLTYSIVSAPSNGSTSLSGSTVTYTPTNNFTGNDSFTFRAHDGSNYSANKTVSIIVTEGYLSSATQIGNDIDGGSGDKQGRSVSFNEDHTVVATGDYNHGSGRGVVRVYVWDGSSWGRRGSEGDALTGPIAGDYNGGDQKIAISLSSDGTILAVGASHHDYAKGTVRVYKWSGSSWSQLGSDLDGTGKRR